MRLPVNRVLINKILSSLADPFGGSGIQMACGVIESLSDTNSSVKVDLKNPLRRVFYIRIWAVKNNNIYKDNLRRDIM